MKPAIILAVVIGGTLLVINQIAAKKAQAKREIVEAAVGAGVGSAISWVESQFTTTGNGSDANADDADDLAQQHAVDVSELE
jgi:hypothetical protein